MMVASQRPSFLFLFILIILAAHAAHAGSMVTRGGNISSSNLSVNMPTSHWAAVVGWMNASVSPDVSKPIGFVYAKNATVYTTYINGSFPGQSAILTRLPVRPSPSHFQSPVPADFGNGGMFSGFTTFAGLDFMKFIESPLYTFCNPACIYHSCNISGLVIPCPYIILNPNINLSILKFNNGTRVEPLFIVTLGPQVGYNTTVFDFQYMMPRNESYYFYVYPECIIDTYIDGTYTTHFPKTGVPYELRVVVRDLGSGAVIPNAQLRLSEVNGRNILLPLFGANTHIQRGYAVADGTGQAMYAVSPTRYNIPDSYGYEIYVEVTSPVYCIKRLNITDYASLSPTYRSSLVSPQYSSQVKSSVQNMNALAATATKWISEGKMKRHAINISEDGTHTAVPVLKAGAPNIINVTALDNLGSPFIADMTVREDSGFIMVVPQQPDKNYSNAQLLDTRSLLVVIPTKYNNNANLTIRLYKSNVQFAEVSFPVDTQLEPPAAMDEDMDEATATLIASSLQNINMVLSNMGASISTI
ncbi:MAG: hypothetical protein QW500_03705 [Candidatus Micrarchaeia archaeon]